MTHITIQQLQFGDTALPAAAPPFVVPRTGHFPALKARFPKRS